MVLVVGLIAWGRILEDRAESDAKNFCDTFVLGSSYLELLERAKSVGEDRLRLIGKESIVVGFTGIPPFSRHLCEVSRTGDDVVGKRYIY